MPAPADVADPLGRLASHAPPGGLDPDALWSRGRRRQGRRTVAALAAVVALAVGGTAIAPDLLARAQRVEPAGSARSMVLPDLIRQPGGWEPAFADVPGRLSAVGVGTRSGLLGDRNALWGVSAVTGQSRWLDLPGALGLAQPALSADGRRLAYWLATTADVEALGGAGEGAFLADGVAVVDLETGERRTWTVESPSGLWVSGLAWAGDVLWWSAGEARTTGTALTATGDVHAWDLGADGSAARRTQPEGRVSANGVGAAPDGFVEPSSARRLAVVSGAGTSTVGLRLPEATRSGAVVTQPTISPDGALLAALLSPELDTPDGTSLSLLVGPVGSGEVRLEPVAGADAQSLVGWRSPTEVVVASVADSDPGRPGRALRASAVDVTTGDRGDLLEFSGNTPEVAADAWAAPVVPAPDAPFAPDPRLVGAGVLLLGLACWQGLRWRRRRVGA